MCMAVGKVSLEDWDMFTSIVGMQQLFSPSDLVAAVGDDFVGVHVGLGAAAGLPHHQGEVVVQLAGDDFVAGLANGRQLLV